ncbi:dienelactone hydrolase family protein [Kutzneria viridogrisea]|uniref:Carboxymethylenebutenolidase n=2 Tax=Kutzneria TaxID=43356 RepID=W5VYN8_9PSEU|nr:dienelactone hydrolase family protein [Kutzneria albida]AHH93560.1 carboxymethylenebutenolidase [Kutzneria albida DSM 43870]MBA8929055.1 carboxymethylenebutenolidase [Kutzneria viridogrisea]
MRDTRTEILSLTDGRELRVTVAEPDGTARGGLVVLHEALGVTDTVRLLVGTLAAEGWLVAAPHLYEEADELPADAVRERLDTLSGEAALADVDVACVWLAQRGITADRIGVIGFDLGGTAALVVATRRALGAAVSVAGGGILSPLAEGLPALVEVAGELSCPWLGIYGDKDEAVSVEEVEKLREAAAAAPVATDVVRFADANHRFDTDHQAAAEAWQRTLNWFDSHLR